MRAELSSFVLLLCVTLTASQSDFLCPANTAMGLCTEVANPCVDDSDCVNGDICCPEACSRACKPRAGVLGRASSSVPDLLNDPRVYVGKCADASCYSFFGGDPDECSTSRLCPATQFCCNDGCKNVCQWKPEYADLIAKQQARARQQRQMIIQKQQLEMQRRQKEMNLQRQRQLATIEQARRKAEARAAAEAELAAQQVMMDRLRYENDLKAMNAARSSTGLDQPKNAPEQTQQRLITPIPETTPAPGSFLENFKSDGQTVGGALDANTSSQAQPSVEITQPQAPPAVFTPGNLPTNKKDNSGGNIIKQINSPASFNPYSRLTQQNSQYKSAMDKFSSIIQSSPYVSLPIPQDPIRKYYASIGHQNPAYRTSFTNPAQNIYPSNSAQNISPTSIGQSARQSSQVAPQRETSAIISQKPTNAYNGIYPKYPTENVYAQNPRQQAPPSYSAPKQPPSSQPVVPIFGAQTYQRIPASNFHYQPPSAQQQQQRSDAMAPYWMFQMMQAA